MHACLHFHAQFEKRIVHLEIGVTTCQCFHPTPVIIHVWTYGGLRSSPLSRNRELMQCIARIGYLKLGVICKCRGRLALDVTRKREELPHPPPSLPFSPLLTTPLSLSLSFSLPPFTKLDLPSSWRRTKRHLTTFVILSDTRFFFLSSSNASRSFLFPFSSFYSPSFSCTRPFRQINNSSRLHAL